MNDEGARRRRWRWIPWRTGLVVAAVAIALNTWVVQTVKVTTGSMQPFLHGDPDNGDRVVVNKTAYRWGEEPERFEPVVFRHRDAEGDDSSPYLVKRVVGFEDELIEIRDGDLWVSKPGESEPARFAKDYASFGDVMTPVFTAAVGGERFAEQFDLEPSLTRWEETGLFVGAGPDPAGAIAVSYREMIRDGYVDADSDVEPGRNVVGDVLLRVRFVPEDEHVGFVAELHEGDRDLFRFELTFSRDHAGREQLSIAAIHRYSAGQGDFTRFNNSVFEPGAEVTVEVWKVDGQLGVAIDEEAMFQTPHDHPIAKVTGDTSIGPRFGFLGGNAEVLEVEIERDLYYTPPPEGAENPVRVPAGHYFMLGDNSVGSHDSRHFGCVAREDLIGRAVAVCWPWERRRRLKSRGR